MGGRFHLQGKAHEQQWGQQRQGFDCQLLSLCYCLPRRALLLCLGCPAPPHSYCNKPIREFVGLKTVLLLRLHTPGTLQIALLVLQGERPQVPPYEALPGPDTASFAGLDAYVQLMR